MSINSVNEFKRVCIENGYSPMEKPSWLSEIGYGYDLTKRDDKYYAKIFADINEDDLNYSFSFVYANTKAREKYERIVEKIKSNCKFYKICGVWATYSCPEASYKGKTAFHVSDKWGEVKNFPSDYDFFRYCF